MRPRKPAVTLESMRVIIADSLNWSYRILAIAIPALIFFMLFLLAGGLGAAAQTIDRLALVGSLQVGLGMFLGFMCLYFGVMMTWVGIESAYDVTGSGKGGEREATLTLKSASPGLLFGLVGAVIIVVSLYKQIEFSETRPVPIEVLEEGSGERPFVKGLKNAHPSSVAPADPAHMPKIPWSFSLPQQKQ